jgi:hypothetical protein
MESTDIVVYIDDKPYRFHVNVDDENDTTTYQVFPDEGKPKLNFMPSELTFNENGHVTLEENIHTVEQEQIARLIWQEIIDKMKP